MAYSIRKPLKKTTKRIIAVILSVIGVILAVVAVKYAVWLYEDIRFKNDPEYIPQWMETKLWKLIDFPDSELLTVEKIQALFPLPEDETQIAALCDELIAMFAERINPKYNIYERFNQDDKAQQLLHPYHTIGSAAYLADTWGMFIYPSKDNTDKGTVEFNWVDNDISISYYYDTEGNAWKRLITSLSNKLTGSYWSDSGEQQYKVYNLVSDEERILILRLKQTDGSIELTKGFIPKGKISVEDLANYRRAQANGDAPKHTTIKEIQKYIKKTKGE